MKTSHVISCLLLLSQGMCISGRSLASAGHCRTPSKATGVMGLDAVADDSPDAVWSLSRLSEQHDRRPLNSDLLALARQSCINNALFCDDDVGLEYEDRHVSAYREPLLAVLQPFVGQTLDIALKDLLLPIYLENHPKKQALSARRQLEALAAYVVKRQSGWRGSMPEFLLAMIAWEHGGRLILSKALAGLTQSSPLMTAAMVAGVGLQLSSLDGNSELKYSGSSSAQAYLVRGQIMTEPAVLTVALADCGEGCQDEVEFLRYLASASLTLEVLPQCGEFRQSRQERFLAMEDSSSDDSADDFGRGSEIDDSH